MLRWPLLLFVLIAACSRGAEADLPSIGAARSLGAEWALVNEQAARGHLTRTYAETMRRSVRAQLRTVQKSLELPRSDYGAEIAALASEPEDTPPGELRAHAKRLKAIEDSLESA